MRKDDEYVRELLTSGEIYASVILALATDRFGSACLSWAPQTLFLEIKDEFGVEPAEIVYDKLMAAIAIVTTDLFFKDVTKFIQICNVLCDSPFNPEVFDPADALECAWGISEALLLVPPGDDPAPFSPEICAYIGYVLHEEGFLRAPDVLGVATGFPKKMRYAFEGNPELTHSVQKEQERKVDEVASTIKENLIELVAQLKRVPLSNGSAADIEKKLEAMLTAPSQ